MGDFEGLEVPQDDGGLEAHMRDLAGGEVFAGTGERDGRDLQGHDGWSRSVG